MKPDFREQARALAATYAGFGVTLDPDKIERMAHVLETVAAREGANDGTECVAGAGPRVRGRHGKYVAGPFDGAALADRTAVRARQQAERVRALRL